ncbi:MAG: NAD-dependent epimerase/dehydratase family protein [Chloroherpetonaceae bacterium]|nr:NAD-dependent epimerase/dehydratase family protein [Chloroherpetonaceae bacterium]
MPPLALVTGATGFVGSWLVELLLQRGYRVRVLTRSSSSRNNLQGLEVEYVIVDYAQPETLLRAIEGVEFVFHSAALTKARSEQEFYRANVEATENLLRATQHAAARLKRFVHISTQAAVGPSPSANHPVDETAPCRPLTMYGRTKLQAELVCKRFMSDLPITIVRPSVVYGPRDRDMLEFFKAVKLGFVPKFGFGVEKRLNIVHVRDLVQGILLAAEHPKSAGETYFISSEQSYTWDEVGEAAKAALGKSFTLTVTLPDWLVYGVAALSETICAAQGKVSIINREKAIEGAQRYWTCSIEKAKSQLGYVPTTSLEQGVAETIAWAKQVGWL